MPSFKLFKILASFLCISLGFLYVLYLIYLPKIIDEKKIEDLINIQLAKNTKFSLDATNLKIYPNYKFDIVLKADELKLKYPTKKDMLVLNNPVIDVSLLSLIKSNIDLNKIKADSVYLNTNFTKTKRYSCFNYIDKEFFITSKNNSKFKLRRVNLVAQKFVFNLYDENISKNFSVKTNKFKLNLNDIDKPFIISTNGVISSSNHKISDFILNLEFKPYKTKVSKFKEKLYNLNYNPLIHADKYKMYSKTEANLKIISSSKTKNITGFVKLNKFSFDINNQRLPENNLLVLFKGDKIITDCDFNLIKEQFIKIKTNANISKNKFIELSLKANSVNLSDLKIVLDAFLKIFNSKIQTEEFSLSGFLDADIYLKSNFKTIVSNGRLNIKNAILSHRKIGIKLDRINSNINLANNKIDILNTTAFIDNAKFYLSGQIDNNANLSLKINSDLLNIAQIIKLLEQLKFASSFKDELNEYKFNSGMLKILAEVKGTIKNPVITTNSKLQKFDVIKNDFHILIDEALITANPVQSKVDSIDITLFKTKFFNKNIDAFIPKMDVLINKTDIIIPKTSLNIFNALL